LSNNPLGIEKGIAYPSAINYSSKAGHIALGCNRGNLKPPMSSKMPNRVPSANYKYN
jgi:hypothetical protein